MKRESFTLRILCLLAILCTMTACGSGGGSSGSTESQVIGTSGGTLSFASGSVVMNIPAGAVTSSTTITVQRSASPPSSPTMIPSLAYDFGPEGTLFFAPVTITIHYDPSQIPAGVSETDLRLCKVSGGAWAGLVVSTVDTAAHTVTGLVTGFSSYGVGSAPLTPLAPPAVPTVPAASGFDNVVNDPAVTGDATQIRMGTTGKDLITQYGGTGNITEVANGNAADDWILQVCGGTTCNQTVDSGNGNDTVYQYGGTGTSTIYAAGGAGNITFIQVGGSGVNDMTMIGDIGTSHLEMYGGPAGNTMEAQGSSGNDLIVMYGGAGTDAMTYDMTSGTDTVVINGGGGTDTLTIYTHGLTNYTIKNSRGNVLYTSGTGGTTIYVANVTTITVRDAGSNIVFTWTGPLVQPNVPIPPAASGFDNVVNDPAVTGDATQIRTGTAGKDRITQYGGTGTVTQSVTGGGGDDWILQVCGGNNCSQSVSAGIGNATVYQFVNGNGSAAQGAVGISTGAKTFIQVGGNGINNMSVDDSASSGGTHIELYGGPAGNTMEVQGSSGNDLIVMYGGAGTDAMTYDMTLGTDTVIINGGGGSDSLTIYTQGLTNYTIKSGSDAVLFTSGTGGTTIKAANVESITVRDQNSNVVFTWP